jgi:hypothetical protein
MARDELEGRDLDKQGKNLMCIENKLRIIGLISMCPWLASPGPYL